MNVRVRPGPLRGRVPAPPSKSVTHRALVLGALADGVTAVRSPLVAADTEATADCLRAMGAKIALSADRATVRGGRLLPPATELDARNSGTTLRLLTAVAALLDRPVVLTGDDGLRRRPLGPLADALGQLGASCAFLATPGCAPVRVQGPLDGGLALVPANVSSQFVSALLVAAGARETETTILLTSELVSAPYVDLTLDLLARFGAAVERPGGAYRVPGGGYRPADVTVAGDYSSAAFLLVAAAVSGGRVAVDNLPANSHQADERVLSILRAAGASVSREDGGVLSEGGALAGVTADLRDSPDLFPVLAVAAAAAKGTTRLLGAPHLRHKETDRIAAVARMLTAFGARVRELPDGMEIEGGRLRGAAIDPEGDHRLAMAAAVAGLVADGETVIRHAECAAVSYPNFFEDLRRLGAEVEGPQ